MIEALLHEFMLQVGKEQIEIYNEFSLQHELGIFLRERLPGYKVQFERNTKYFGLTDLVKHEIDIVVYDDVRKYAVELKYPLNGQHPEQMFSFVKDICFMEQLKMKGFEKTYCMTVVKDKKFYSGTKKDGIYAYFRDRKPITGIITKPTGAKDERITIEREYSIEWNRAGEEHKYYIVEIS